MASVTVPAPRHPATLGAHRLLELVHHGGPQEDRHHVRLRRVRLLHRRRPRGAADPQPSSRSPTTRCSTPTQYNQIFTMHGITMIFLFVMPMSAAFFNYLIPLMIGARDVAFPRLNAYSFWVFLLGGLFLYSSSFLGGAPNGGWFGVRAELHHGSVDRHDVLRDRAADHRHRVDRPARSTWRSPSSTCARRA